MNYAFQTRFHFFRFVFRFGRLPGFRAGFGFALLFGRGFDGGSGAAPPPGFSGGGDNGV